MKQIPNLFTLLNLFFGCIAIVFMMQNGIAISGDENGSTWIDMPESIWMASLFIGLAAVVDFLDGFLARLLGAGSEMGKQLDSLADVVAKIAHADERAVAERGGAEQRIGRGRGGGIGQRFGEPPGEAGDADREEQAQVIARATGGRGRNRDYLWSTAAHLAELGISDPDLDWLAERVRALT